MSARHPMTSYGHRTLSDELVRLKGSERVRIANAIEVAREHGDLRENAEYHAAKEEQGMLEARIRMIEERLSFAHIVDVSSISGDKVVFGATVELFDADSGEERTVTIVGEDESNIDRGLISYTSPLAKALISKSIDDLVRVRLPSGEREYEIKAVRFDFQG